MEGKTMEGNQNRAMGKLQRESQHGMGLVLVMLLALVSTILVSAVTVSITSTSRQSRLVIAHEEAYGTALAALNTVLFQMEAAMGGNDPPDTITGLEDHLTDVFGNAAHNGTIDYTGTIGGIPYTVKLTDATQGDYQFQLASEVSYDQGYTRRVSAIIRTNEVVEALKYAIYGNYVHFDNHNHTNWGINLVTSVFSNSGILIDKGVKIDGPVQAVQYISPNTGPADGDGSVSDTILTEMGFQGDPSPSPVVGSAPVNQAIPGPPLKEFPIFELYEVKEIADAAGRSMTASEFTTLMDNARDFAVTQPASDTAVYLLPAADYPGSLDADDLPIEVMHRNSTNHRVVRIPNGDNIDYFVELGTVEAGCPTYPCAAGTGADETYEIIFSWTGSGQPADTRFKDNDSVFYIEGDMVINQPFDTLVRVEGSLIVNGSAHVKSAVELLAWEDRQPPWFVPLDDSLYDNDADGFLDFAYNNTTANNPADFDIRWSRYPALAANGKIKIDGDRGPAHIEGTVYTISESHLHRSDPWAPAYSVGSQIADTIHNCEFFSFVYDPAARQTVGLYDRLSARPTLRVVRLQDE